jgi:hypothetical protein
VCRDLTLQGEIKSVNYDNLSIKKQEIEMDSRRRRISAEASRNHTFPQRAQAVNTTAIIQIPIGGSPGIVTIHCGRDNAGTDVQLTMDFGTPTSATSLYDTSDHNAILGQEECEDLPQRTGSALDATCNYNQFVPDAHSTFRWPIPDDTTHESWDMTPPDRQNSFSQLRRQSSHHSMVEGTDFAQSPVRRGSQEHFTPRQVHFVVMWLAHH